MSKVIIIYGPIAVGKLTVAKMLSEKLGYKLTHNHSINDLVTDIFDKKSREYDNVVEKMRFTFLTEIVRNEANIVTTHCYAHDFVNKTTGLSDPEYMVRLVHVLKEAGAEVYVVHLKADNEVLIRRVSGESRKAHRKLVDEDEMRRISEKRDWQTSAPIPGQIIIDTTNLSPEETTNIIISGISDKL